MTPIDPHDFANDQDQRDAHDPTVGAGAPDTAPWESIEIPWLRRQPLIALILAVQLPALAALVTELASDTQPAVAALLAGVVTILTVGGRLAWKHVTPTARPRLAPDVPLAPGDTV